MSQTVELHWTVKSVSPEGLAELTQTIDRVRPESRARARPAPFEFDSAVEGPPKTPARSPRNWIPLLKALVGAEFAFKMNSKGELSDITIPDRLMESIRQANPGGGESRLLGRGDEELDLPVHALAARATTQRGRQALVSANHRASADAGHHGHGKDLYLHRPRNHGIAAAKRSAWKPM